MDGMLGGVLLGLSVAAPIGPTGVLCIQRSLAGGFVSGFAAGLGAATVHAAYSWLAGVGLALMQAVSGSLPGHAHALRFVSVAVLLWLGCRILSRGASATAPGGVPTAVLSCYLAALAITLTNPVTASLMMTLSLPASAAGAGGTDFPLGVFLGSAFWWLILSGAVSLARVSLGDRGVRRINHVCGVGIIALAVAWAMG